MTWKSPALIVAFAFTLGSSSSWGAPPKINNISPLGARRGMATEVTINGGGLGSNPQLIAPFAFTLGSPPATKSDAGNWRINLIVDPATGLGVYPVRVKSDDGISNPFLLVVGQLPQIAEKEDNGTVETAQAISTPVVVDGQSAGNDVDYFRFPGKKGQKIAIDAQCSRIGSGVDPTIRLTTASRAYVASADDSPGLLTDARLVAVLPEDTDYVVEISDSRYQGTGRAVYRLLIGAVPMVDEVFPIGGRQGETVGLELRGGTLTDVRVAATTVKAATGLNLFSVRTTNQMLGLAQPGEPVLDVESMGPLIVGAVPEVREASDPAAPPSRSAVPAALNGRIDPAGDEDNFLLAVTPGQRLHVEVQASEYGSSLDGVLQILGANGSVIATGDDTNVPVKTKQPNIPPNISPDPSLDFTVPAGLNEVTVKLRDLEGRGGIGYPYRIVVSPANPSFDLELNDSEISIPKGGSAAVAVSVVRKGYTGPITLNVPAPPAGVTVRPGTIAAGQLLGTFTLAASNDANFGAVHLRVVGEGQGPVVREAFKDLVFAQQGNLPINTVNQTGLPAAPAPAPAVTLDAPDKPVEIAHGYGTPVTVKVTRPKGADAALAVTPLPLPPGLAVPATNIAEKAAEGKIPVNAAVEAPLGTMTIALVAKGKFGGQEQTITVPAITLNVVRPANVELGTKAIEVKAGATFELKGKVVRKEPFKEPVTVRINGLPAGLKADPVTVAPTASDFVIKVVADPKAAAATVNGNVAVAFQVNKKDYPSSPLPLGVKVLPANAK